MPEKKNTGPSYETIMRDLEARRFSPIYILMGEESYYIDKISDYIATHVLKPEERDFNQNIVFGANCRFCQGLSDDGRKTSRYCEGIAKS